MRSKELDEGAAWRKKAFGASTTFKEALVVVQNDLCHAMKKRPEGVKKFVLWVQNMLEREQIASRREIREKIEEFPNNLSASLRLYIGFVLRFHVNLEFSSQSKKPRLILNFRDPRHSQLNFTARGGMLTPPPTEPDADARDQFAAIGGNPAQIRGAVKRKGARILLSKQIEEADLKLINRGMPEEEVLRLREIQRKRGINEEDRKLRILEVDAKESSSITHLLDAAYDPLSVTFLLVRSRGQTRVMCLAGELAGDDDWNQLGVVRAAVHKVLHKKAPAGAPFNVQQFADDIRNIPSDGRISKNSAINAIGGKGSDSDINRAERRLRRAMLRADRVRRSISFR